MYAYCTVTRSERVLRVVNYSLVTVTELPLRSDEWDIYLLRKSTTLVRCTKDWHAAVHEAGLAVPFFGSHSCSTGTKYWYAAVQKVFNQEASSDPRCTSTSYAVGKLERIFDKRPARTLLLPP